MSGVPSSSFSAPSGLPFPQALNISIDNLHTAVKAIESNNIAIVIRGLNFILLKSYESNNDANPATVLQLEEHPRLLHALCDLLDVVNPSVKCLFEELPSQSFHRMMQEEFDGKPWDLNVLSTNKPEFKFLAKHLDENTVFLSILGIIRNLSFEVSQCFFHRLRR